MHSQESTFHPKGIMHDKEGRYILVNGIINEHEVIFILYYAPNSGQTASFNEMLGMLMPHTTGHIIFGDDDNTP